MKGRGTDLAFGLGLLLLFRGPLGLAQQPQVSDAGEWMLEITRANRAPHYSPMSAGGKEDQTVFNELDWQPGWDHADKRHPQPTGLGFICQMQGTEVRVRVYLELDSGEGLSSSGRELTVGNYLIRGWHRRAVFWHVCAPAHRGTPTCRQKTSARRRHPRVHSGNAICPMMRKVLVTTCAPVWGCPPPTERV